MLNARKKEAHEKLLQQPVNTLLNSEMLLTSPSVITLNSSIPSLPGQWTLSTNRLLTINFFIGLIGRKG